MNEHSDPIRVLYSALCHVPKALFFVEKVVDCWCECAVKNGNWSRLFPTRVWSVNVGLFTFLERRTLIYQ